MLGTAVANVRDYGARGDGVADDREAIQHAIDVAEENGVGVVYFPKGTYLVSHAADYDTRGYGLGIVPYGLTFRGLPPRLAFVGDGREASVLKKTPLHGRTADYSLLWSVNVGDPKEGLLIQDLGFDGGQTGADTPFITGDEHILRLDNCIRPVIRDCLFRNGRGGGVIVFRCRYATISGCHFELLSRHSIRNALSFEQAHVDAEPYAGGHVASDCTFVNNGQIALSVSNITPHDVRISNMVVHNDIAVAPAGQAMELLSCERVNVRGLHVVGGAGVLVAGKDIVFDDCTFKRMDRADSGAGHAFDFNNPPATERVTLSNVYVDTTRDEALLLGGQKGGTGQLTFLNVQVVNAGKEAFKERDEGPADGPAGQPHLLAGAVFMGCRAVDSQRDGFWLNSRDVHFVECWAVNNGRGAPGNHSGLVLGPDGERTLVMGGRFTDTVGVQRYGISNHGTGTQVVGAVLGGVAGGIDLGRPLAWVAPSPGGNRQVVDGWYRDDLRARRSALPLNGTGGAGAFPNAWIAPRAGSLVGLAVKSNEARRGGILTVEVYRNGAPTGLKATLDQGSPAFAAGEVPPGATPFAGGDEIDVRVTTDAAWSPTTASVRASLEVAL